MMSRFGLGLGGLTKGGGAAPYLGIVATRGILPQSGGFNAGVTELNGRMAHWLRSDVTSVRLVYTNWKVTQSTSVEAGTGGTMSIRAALETAGGTRTQVTFSGAAQGTVADGGTLVSDAISWTGASGDKFYTRTQQLNASGCIFYAEKADSSIGDRFDFDGTDHTMSGTIADGFPTYAYGPAAIIGITRRRGVFIVGTSRTFGINDAVDGTGDLGITARCVGPSNGYVSCGIPSESAANFKTNYTKRSAIWQYASDIIVELGANDNVATIQADLATIYALFTGKRVWGVTVSPRTSGAWTNVDGSDQTVAVNFTNLNNYVAGVPSPLSGYFDLNAPVSLVGTPTKWKAPGYTTDGIHESQTAAQAVATAKAAEVAAALA